MSAFAAILTTDAGSLPPGDESRAVAAALASVTGTSTRQWQQGACELLFAALHPWDPREPVIVDGGRIAAAGQVMLEDRVDLARTLQLPPDTRDTYLVAAAFDRWGAGLAQRLRGEYAFAVWDSGDRRLTCARDPLGIRPLYVGSSSRVIVVSNVVDAVVAHPAISNELDDSALVRFLVRGVWTSAVATPYRAVRLVPEGHTLTIAWPGQARLIRHWQPPSPQPSLGRSDHDAATAYREVLRNAVRDRIGGRRCAIFLSGGMDSTSLAAVGVECASQMHAFTFAYQQLEVPGEVPLAQAVANRLSLPLDVINGDADVALEAERTGDVPALPVDEPSITNWRTGLHAASSFSTLAVYGEDGDALFAPPGGSALLAAQSFPSLVRATIGYMATRQRIPYVGLRLRERLGLVRSRRLPDTPWITPGARRLAEAPEETTVLRCPLQPIHIDPRAGRVWDRLLRNVPRAFAISISPDVTRQCLALTLPLMDTRVIDFVMTVPPVPWCQNKHLARIAFAERLPSAVLSRRKITADGLDAALVNRWRRHHLGTALHSMSSAIHERNWVDTTCWAEAVEHGAPEVVMAAWRVLLLDAWLARTSRKAVPCIS